MYKKSGIGYCLVITEATRKSDTGIKGVNGQNIVIDTDWNPLKYTLNFAEVIQLPISMGNTIIEQQHQGKPGYGPINLPLAIEQQPSYDLYAIGGVYKYKFVHDIVPEVKIGDKIYFKPRSLNSKGNMMGVLKDDNGKNQKYIYKIQYENILCAVRDGKIIMIGGWVLVDPIMEDYEDILIKTYYPYKDPLGAPIERPKKEWIQTKANPTHDNLRGFVRHVGTPLKGDVCDFKPHALVIFRKQARWMQEIEGKKYFVMRQNDILCELKKNVKVK